MVGFIVAIVVLISGIVVAHMIDKREAPGLKVLIPVVSIIVAAVLTIGSCVSYVPTGYLCFKNPNFFYMCGGCQ